MAGKSLSVEMRVLVAHPLTGDIRGDVGKTGTIVGIQGRWWLVALDGESTPVPFREVELEPLTVL
jgi:hypothetical protein